MPDEILSSVNAEPAPTVEAQTDTTPVVSVDDAVPATQQTEVPQTEVKPKQTPEENARYAAIRRQAEAEALAKAKSEAQKEYDALIAEVFAQQGIKSAAELKDAWSKQKMQEEAAKQNIPLEVMEKLTETQRQAQEALSKLSAYERKESIAKQAERIAADEKWGAFYGEHKDEIHTLADTANIDLDTAKVLVLDRYGVPKVDTEAIKKQGVQEYLDNIRKGNKPIEGSGATPVTVVDTPHTFDDARKGALAVLRASRES